MIIRQEFTMMVAKELDQLMEQDHHPSYRRAFVDFYSGKVVERQQESKVDTIPSSARKVLIPDKQTQQTCLKINKILLYGRSPHESSHGFERQRDVESFIDPHRSQARMLSIYLEDAFSRIGKKRVRSIGSRLLGLDEQRATYLAQLLTVQGRLVAGNPLSPQILNIHAYKTDRYLTQFSEKYKLTYTRYLDGLCFSARSFIQTETIAKIKRIISRCGWVIDNDCVDIQSGNHFHIAGQVVPSARASQSTKAAPSTPKKTNLFHGYRRSPQSLAPKSTSKLFPDITRGPGEREDQKRISPFRSSPPYTDS